eukprot:1818688-Alexandrium_andersonii.AAC.1
MLAVMRSGRNPTMRYLHRAHRVSVQWLRERFTLLPESVEIFYEDSCDMRADMYTNSFADATKWSH